MTTHLNTKPFPDTKHVKNGILVQTSPSAIEAWDDSTAFGCNRRWFYQYVQGIKGPETDSQALGTALHTFIESHINPHLVYIAPSRDVTRLFLAVKPTVDEIIEEGIVAVESWMDLDLVGVKINGRIDIRTKTGILDWKTSSDISKYAKTPGQLRRSTQMLLYAKWLQGQGGTFPMTLEHVYVQTKGKPLVERVKAKIDKGSLDVGVDGIINIIEEMKVAAGELDVSKLKADRTKCRMCPYNNLCPKENTTMANLLSRLKSASTPEAAPEAVVETFSVLPPDAPKSDPALAALPVPGFSVEKVAVIEATPTAPEPAAPGRRGRPPGAKNKMKFVDVPDEIKPGPSPVATPVAVKEVLTVTQALTAPVVEAVELDYQSVTVAFGATIPTAQFANQRLDVTLTARFTGDVDKATAEVSEKVRALVIKELEKISLTLAGPVLKP